ncbi:SRPBCC family protein [Thermomonas sp.]|uniref:SRPBCC family protein n=1 Tax=Thermomonas sp. TaxID=1971895 RepID=UPI003D10A0F6
MTIDLHEDIAAPIETVWACLTDAEAVACWFGAHMRLDARAGGGFVETWRDGDRTVTTRGTVLRIEPPHRLDLSWRDDDWPEATEVSIALEPRGTSTRLRLCHAGWTRLGAEGEALAEAHRAGWATHLRALRHHAEAVARAAPLRDGKMLRRTQT